MTAPGAEARQRQVEHGMLPAVIFAGETEPQTLFSRMAAEQLPGLSVAVIRNGAIDWSAAYGQRGNGGLPVGCDTLFQAGSLSKPVTVLAALRMSRAGLLDLDRDVDELLRSVKLPPGAQTAANPVTLRNLFTHTSGLRPGGYGGYAPTAPLPDLPQIIMGSPPANSPKIEVLAAPNGRLQYSGGGYTVAQQALEDQFGESFERLMQTWVLGPAGMRQASFSLLQPGAQPALGHGAAGRVVPGGWHHHPESAAAGLWATASDLAQFLIEIWKGWHGRSAVFDQASIRELLASPIAGHAYGFRLLGEGDQQFIVHYGGTTGYNAGMAINVVSGQGAAYLANAEQGGRVIGHEFFMAVAAVEGWSQFRDAVHVRRAAAPSAAELKALAGRYRFKQSGLRVTAEFVEAEGVLVLVFPNRDRYSLVPIVDSVPLQFIHAATGVRAGFERPQVSGTPARLHLYGDEGEREPKQ